MNKLYLVDYLNMDEKDLMKELKASNKEVEVLEATASNLKALGKQAGGLIATHTWLAEGRRNKLVVVGHKTLKDKVEQAVNKKVFNKEDIASLIYDNRTYYKEDLEAYIRALSGIVEYEILR